ncbi:MAG: oligosaccharide flippase family protein [Myxococcota bacterium]
MTEPRDPRSGPGDDAEVRDAADLARGVLVNAFGTLVKASRALFVLFAAHFYGAEALGLYFLAMGAAEVTTKVARFGLDRSLVREATRGGDQPGGMLRYHVLLGLALSLVFGVGLALAAPFLARTVFDDPHLVDPIRLAAAGLPLIVVLEILLAGVRARRRMGPDALIRGAVEPFALLGFAVLLYAVRPADPLSLVASQVGAWGVAAVAAAVAVRRVVGRDAFRGRAPAPDRRRAVIRFSLPLGAMDALNVLVSKTDLFLLGILMSGGAVGVYGLIVELISVVKRVWQAFEPITAPILAELHHVGDRRRLARHYGLATRWLLAGSLLPLLALTLFAPEALAIFDVSGREAEIALLVLASAHTILAALHASENLLVMAGHTGLNAALAFLVGAINVGVGLVLIPRLGLPGAAAATLVAYVVLSGSRVVAGRWYAGVHPFGRHLAWPLIAAAVTFAAFGAVLHFAAPVPLPWKILLLAAMIAAYATLLLLGATEPEECHLVGRARSLLLRLPGLR